MERDFLGLKKGGMRTKGNIKQSNLDFRLEIVIDINLESLIYSSILYVSLCV